MPHADQSQTGIVRVSLGTRSYDIVISNGRTWSAAKSLAGWLQHAGLKGIRCLMVTDAAVQESHGDAVRSSLELAGAEVRTALVPSGEQSKSYEQTGLLYDCLLYTSDVADE